jgi:hypothetical protein
MSPCRNEDIPRHVIGARMLRSISVDRNLDEACRLSRSNRCCNGGKPQSDQLPPAFTEHYDRDSQTRQMLLEAKIPVCRNEHVESGRLGGVEQFGVSKSIPAASASLLDDVIGRLPQRPGHSDRRSVPRTQRGKSRSISSRRRFRSSHWFCSSATTLASSASRARRCGSASLAAASCCFNLAIVCSN